MAETLFRDHGRPVFYREFDPDRPPFRVGARIRYRHRSGVAQSENTREGRWERSRQVFIVSEVLQGKVAFTYMRHRYEVETDDLTSAC